MFLPTPLYDIVNITLHISLKNFEQQCNGINSHFAALHGYSIEAPPICPSYPSNICGVSQPGIHLSTSISGGYANSSCAITESTGVPDFSSTPTTMKQFSAKAIDNSLFL